MNVSIKLNFSFGYIWYEFNGIYVKGYLFDDLDNLYVDKSLVDYFENVKTEEQFKSKLSCANGIFSVIINRDGNTFFAVDRTRTFPLFYVYNQKQLVISDDTNYLKDLFSLSLNRKNVEEFISTGFVTGKNTLIDEINQVQAGEYLIWSNTRIKNKIYYSYLVTSTEIATDVEGKLKNIFSDILDRLANRMMMVAKGRQLVIPLSGGFDSRLIVSLLKRKRYENVVCFTYGSKDSFEVKISKDVAEKLSYRWYFIEYNNETILNDYTSQDDFKKYYPFAANNVSNFLLQDYFAVKYLHDNNLISKDAIIIPGHSGDFLGGSHLRSEEIITKDNLLSSILRKHYSLSQYDENMKLKVLSYIERNMNDYLSYSVNENFNMKERQSKFIVNANRVYEYFGYQHMIPLWDKELVEFFRILPLQFKFSQENMYNSVLFERVFNQLNLVYSKDFLIQSGFKRFIKKILKQLLPMFVKKVYARKSHIDFNRFSIMSNVLLKDLNEPIHYNNINLIIAKWYVNKIIRDTDTK